jgi:hypothetical protein
MNSVDSSYSTILRFNRESEDELLLEGNSLPLESTRSCELAVECWNLRSSLAEADQSFHYTKNDLKTQKYTLRRVQDEMVLLRRSMVAKDIRLEQQSDKIDGLKILNERSESSRRCIINTISKTEHNRKVTSQMNLQLEVENRTIKSQL